MWQISCCGNFSERFQKDQTTQEQDCMSWWVLRGPYFVGNGVPFEVLSEVRSRFRQKSKEDLCQPAHLTRWPSKSRDPKKNAKQWPKAFETSPEGTCFTYFRVQVSISYRIYDIHAGVSGDSGFSSIGQQIGAIPAASACSKSKSKPPLGFRPSATWKICHVPPPPPACSISSVSSASLFAGVRTHSLGEPLPLRRRCTAQ